MRLNHLKINGFGKFINKEISLLDKINIIYGLNESGKSTIQKFIYGMMFGMSKNKNGKDMSDYDKLYPWNGLEYSGKISYILDNGEKYEIFRDFNKKDAIIYDKSKNDISSKFLIDKNKGNLFFEEQTGIDEKLFLDTAFASQKNVKLDKISQSNIIQKITNLISSGDENISYNKTIEKIKKQQNDVIGSTRSTQKPINKINQKILELEAQKLELKDSNIQLEDIYNEENNNLKELNYLNNKLNLIQDMKAYLEGSKIQFAEVDFGKKLEEEYDNKIADLKNKIDLRAKQNIRFQKKNYKLNYIITIILFIINIALYISFKKLFYLIPTIIILVLNIFYIIFSKMKNNKEIKEKLKQIDELQNKIDKEIEILKKNKDQKKFENQIKSDRLNISIIKNEENLHEKYYGKIEDKYIEKIFAMELDELQLEQNLLLNQISDLKIKINTLNLEREKIESKIKDLENIDTNLKLMENEKQDLDSLNTCYNLAIEVLSEAYEEMKEKVSPNLTQNLNKIIENVSNGKYSNLIFDEEKGLCVELENGQYISCERLSIGTIDEIYLSLRLSVLEKITTESLPIILDEAFAYFDDQRLENLLLFLKKQFLKNQIIIFTCTNREIDIFEKNRIDYNLINL